MTTISLISPAGADFNSFKLAGLTGRQIGVANSGDLEWAWGIGTSAQTLSINGTGLIPVVTGGVLSDLNGGTITSLIFKAPGVGVDFEFTHMAMSAVSFYDLVAAKNWSGLKALFLAGNDKISGTQFGDNMQGLAGKDLISGGGGDDTLSGGAGKDTLIGGAGLDHLTGGGGADRFEFDLAPAIAGADTITDFKHGTDHIALKASAFADVGGAGTLLDAHFHLGTAAVTAAQGVIYDSATGNIYSDADGSGAAAQILFAHVNPGTILTASDFLVF